MMTADLTSEMIDATRDLIGRLRAWSMDPEPQIGHASAFVPTRLRAARSLQRGAAAYAGRLEALLERPDALEDELHEASNRTANMDANEAAGIRHACRAATAAAIARLRARRAPAEAR